MAPCACSCCDHGHCSAVIAQTLIKCSTYACTKGLRKVVCCSARIRTKPRQALEQASRQGSGCVCVQVFQKVQQSMDIKSSSQVHRRERCAERHGAQAVGSGSYREQGIEDSTVTETTQCGIVGIPSGTSDGDGWVHGSDITHRAELMQSGSQASTVPTRFATDKSTSAVFACLSALTRTGM